MVQIKSTQIATGRAFFYAFWYYWKGFKVAEHSFQVPMPNSPLLLNYL